jgi:hypothetical protein
MKQTRRPHRLISSAGADCHQDEVVISEFKTSLTLAFAADVLASLAAG